MNELPGDMDGHYGIYEKLFVYKRWKKMFFVS